MFTFVLIVENACVASGGRVVIGTGTCVHWLVTMTEKTLRSRVKGGMPIKILDTPPIVLNARTDLPRPLLRPLTQRTTPANWLPLFSGLGNAFDARSLVHRIAPCLVDLSVTLLES